MITIDYSNEKDIYTLDLVGHAHYAKPGSDIVCAAVSMMFQSLVSKMIKMKDLNNIDNVELEVASGESHLKVYNFDNLISGLVVRELFSMAVDAFIQLSIDYPNNVKVGTLPDSYRS